MLSPGKQPLQLNSIVFKFCLQNIRVYHSHQVLCTLIKVNRQLRERNVESPVKQTCYWAFVKKADSELNFSAFVTSHTDTYWDTGPESHSRKLKVGRSWEMSHVVPEAVCACVWVLYVLYVWEFSIGEPGGVSLWNSFWNHCLWKIWKYHLFSLWFPCSRCAYAVDVCGVFLNVWH